MDNAWNEPSHPSIEMDWEFYITECGKEKCSPLKDIVSFSKPYPVLHFIQNGKGTFILNNKTYFLGKGDVFYIPSGWEAHYYPDKKEPWTYAWMGFSSPNADSYLSLSNLSLEQPIYSKIKDNTLNDTLHELIYHFLRSGGNDLRTIGYGYVLLGSLISRAYDTTKRVLTQKESHVKEAKDFVANNYQFPITVKDISSSVNLTTNYLSNIFQETLSISPKQYLTKYRMDKACALLMNPKIMVKDVAIAVGYSNQLHFSSEFKKVKGLSPKHFQDMKFKKNKEDYR